MQLSKQPQQLKFSFLAQASAAKKLLDYPAFNTLCAKFFKASSKFSDSGNSATFFGLLQFFGTTPWRVRTALIYKLPKKRLTFSSNIGSKYFAVTIPAEDVATCRWRCSPILIILIGR